VKINFKFKKNLLIPGIFASVFIFFLVANLLAKAPTAPLYNACFSGTSLPSTISVTRDAPRIAEKGISGYLTFGPYVTLNPGIYNVTLSYTADVAEPNSPIGVVDRAAASLAIPGTEAPLIPKNSGENQYSVDFETKSQLDGFEFRVFANGKSTMEVKELCIKQTE
jgi:hypothetical protein